jgi:hypothetical protein
MAKYVCDLNGNFDELLNTINAGVLNGSISANFEDGSDCIINDVRCAVRVYERYSILGKNRVSMNITLIGYGDKLTLTAITSGGSQAVFLKINIIGEESFLYNVKEIVENYKNSKR